MKRVISLFLVLVLLATIVLPVLPTPVAAAGVTSRYCVLVLDVSGSETFNSNGVTIYTADTAIEHVKTAAARFLEDLLYAPGNNYVALVTYDDSVTTLSGFTNNVQTLQRQVSAITAGSRDRDIASGLATANSLLTNISDLTATKNVVLFTTGMTDCGSYDYDGYYDSNVVGHSWRNSGTDVRLYAYANAAIAAAAELKETATIYTLGLFQTMVQIPQEGKDIAEFFRLTAKDLASSEECFFDVSNPSELEFAFAEIAEDIAIEPKLFRYGGNIENRKDSMAEYYYHDNYFFKPSSLYNPSLATMSLCLELSCWSSWEKKNWFDPNNPESMDDKLVNAKTLLMGDPLAGEGYEGIGFEDFDANAYWAKEPEMNSIGVCTARKEITDKRGKSHTLIAVAIRGGGYYSEWGGNFVVGEENEHEGFELARKEVADFLSNYIQKLEREKKLEDNIKLWIVGYSRAGAVANMLAGSLNDNNTFLGKSINPEDIFCYTFEAPQGALASQMTGTYRNIHNILNANDLVPFVAPSAWGFARYNYTNTTYLPTRYTTAPDLFDEQLKAMKQELAELGFGEDVFTYRISEYSTIKNVVFDRHHILLMDIPKWSLVENTTDTHVALREGVDLLALLLGGRVNYAQELQPALTKLLSILNHYSGSAAGLATYEEDLVEFFSFDTMLYILAPIFSLNPFYSQEARLAEVTKRTGEKVATIFDELIEIDNALEAVLVDALGGLLLKIAEEALVNNIDSLNDSIHLANVLISSKFQGHYPEICLAWCRSLDPNYNTNITQEPSSAVMRIVRINCPVDVFVYDENDQVLATIVDDVPAENNRLVCYLNSDGEKLVYLPANGDYHLEIQATDEGEVHYSVGEYSLAHGQMVYLENYYNIPISTGDVLTAEAPAASRDALKENALSGTGADYALKKNYSTLYADETYSGADAKTIRRAVTVETQGNGGYAIGTGTFIQGSVAQVEASTLPNGEFLGWKDTYGNTLSTDLIFRFPVQQDTTITAVFSDITYSELSLKASKGGRIEASDGHFPEGIEISMLAVPDKGYRFVGWKTSAGELDSTKSEETVFRMPDEDVTVTAKFEKIDADDETSDSEFPLIALLAIISSIFIVAAVIIWVIITRRHKA